MTWSRPPRPGARGSDARAGRSRSRPLPGSRRRLADCASTRTRAPPPPSTRPVRTPEGSRRAGIRAAWPRRLSWAGSRRVPLSKVADAMDAGFGTEFTVGLEEELLLIDPATRDLVPVATEVLGRLDTDRAT